MASPYDSSNPIVGIVMGSDSDWPVMEAAVQALEEFGIPYEVDVVSAHRMPQDMIAYGRKAHERGLRVIIAGAGGAAHLPGMLASVTPLPVVGVPIKLKSLDGMDSLLSIVQMPAGVPVATVSIDGARNAGLLALRILGSGDDGFARQVRSDLVDFAASLRQSAQDKGSALRAKVQEYKDELDESAPRPALSQQAPKAATKPTDEGPKTPYAP
ncbi:5-(carboxyamino)imidazole ribonucleotide mutase [Rothia sp. CCM 9416]|uniref:5-(carboxyamino)imidazole ribonucleotide mutase n=1 Tax=Rothia sp. CCM 9416 TaxID=3402655 RepID=UPI003AECF862